MGIRRLQIRDFRCLRSIDIEFGRSVNLIEGENASGKTSLLEAMFTLGRGRSFRSTRLASLVRDECSEFTVVGWIESGGGERVAGISGSGQGLEAHLGGSRVRGLAELAEALPVQNLDPDVHRLVEDGPARRRQFLDWGVFHVEPSFISAWRRYRKANQQRNVLLRTGGSDAAVRAWETELASAAADVDVARAAYAERLQEAAQGFGKKLLGETLFCDYRRGWPQDQDLATSLAQNRVRDREYGAAQLGPHRADLRLGLGGRPARGRVSRGQQKLVSAAITLAQMQILYECRGESGVLLMDDPEAELDDVRVERLIGLVCSLPVQVFVTQLPDRTLPLPRETERFHVEHGTLRRVI
jgi:DNA replication and repair protein RecF